MVSLGYTFLEIKVYYTYMFCIDPNALQICKTHHKQAQFMLRMKVIRMFANATNPNC